MPLTIGQASQSPDDVFTLKARGIFNAYPFQHFYERRTAGERRRTAVGQKRSRLNSSILETQEKREAVAAHWIRLVSVGVSVRQLARAARIGKMVFEKL